MLRSLFQFSHKRDTIRISAARNRQSMRKGIDKRMKRIILGSVIMSIMAVLLMGCGNTTVPLAEVFRQEQLEAQTIQIVDWLNSGAYELVYETFREDMQQVLPVEEIRSACMETFGNAGDFVKYGNTVVNGQKIEEEDYAVVMVKAQYEKQNVTFQVGYDAEMKVVGLYMK